MVTDGQVRVLRRKLLMEGKTQEAAAAGAGMSVRSARRSSASEVPDFFRANFLRGDLDIAQSSDAARDLGAP